MTIPEPPLYAPANALPPPPPVPVLAAPALPLVLLPAPIPPFIDELPPAP